MSKFVNFNNFNSDNNSIMSKIQTAGKNMATSSMFMIIAIIIFVILAIIFYYYYVSPRLKVDYKANREGDSFDNNSNNSNNSNNGNGKQAELLFFYADWCPHCKTAKPIWEDLKSEYQNKTINGYHVIFTDINCSNETAEVEKMMDKYKIEGFPTIKLLKDGQVIEYDAKPTRETLDQFLNTVL